MMSNRNRWYHHGFWFWNWSWYDLLLIDLWVTLLDLIADILAMIFDIFQ